MKRWFLWACGALAALILLAALVWTGILRPNAWVAARYPVRGVDVSEYQGDIDWQTLSGGLDFAFVKATEGAGNQDPAFERNFRAAAEAGLLTGAYHFFSFESDGAAQAENFIQTAGDLSGRLSPVVDVELYGAFKSSPPEKEDVRAQLDALLKALEARYGVKPILYATSASWSMYLQDGYSEYPLWIRDVYWIPGMAFAFWQYSDRGRLAGYDGPEKFIDLDVFGGSKDALEALALP